MMLLPRLFIVALSIFVVDVSAQEIVTSVHDFDGLKEEIDLANQRSPDTLTSIYIGDAIYWPPGDDPALPPIQKNVRIVGGVFSEVDGGGAELFVVESSGKLTVEGSWFVEISQASPGPTIFTNHGELVLDDVRFTAVTGLRSCGNRPVSCRHNPTALIHNTVTGRLVMSGARFAESGIPIASLDSPSELMNGILFNEGTAELIRTQVYLSDNRWEQPLFNSGFMRLQNSSFMVRNEPDIASVDLLGFAEGAQTESVNSVFEGFTGAWCSNVESLGHNSTSAHDCSWDSTGDAVGITTGLIRQLLEQSFQLVPGTYTFNLIPSAASSLIDSANARWCPDDGLLIIDGNGDGTAICDRGAWEYQPTSLSDGGANGLYFDPNQNGHYVYILDNDYNTLVMWTTFDRSGNQAWVFAIGDLAGGRSMIADAYINENGELTNTGPINVDRDRFWGTIQLELRSCDEGTFYFNSDLPEFTSGQFQIRRLAYVTQIGCED